MTKKNILKIASIYIFYVIILLLISSVCSSDWCEVQENGFFGLILFAFAPLFPVFIFSLVTYTMHDKVFRAWWNFARWFVSVIVVMTLLLSISDSRGGGGMGGGGLASGMLEFAVLGLLYSVFILGSLFKIIWEYLGIKDKEKHQ